uniref:Uncharacterized protein n=1 Tax=Anguilla anguilla TaxID=7936 RepID=A0A0E9X252_ANGAN
MSLVASKLSLTSALAKRVTAAHQSALFISDYKGRKSEYFSFSVKNLRLTVQIVGRACGVWFCGFLFLGQKRPASSLVTSKGCFS